MIFLSYCNFYISSLQTINKSMTLIPTRLLKEMLPLISALTLNMISLSVMGYIPIQLHFIYNLPNHKKKFPQGALYCKLNAIH